jgi:hypothetical protein
VKTEKYVREPETQSKPKGPKARIPKTILLARIQAAAKPYLVNVLELDIVHHLLSERLGFVNLGVLGKLVIRLQVTGLIGGCCKK